MYVCAVTRAAATAKPSPPPNACELCGRVTIVMVEMKHPDQRYFKNNKTPWFLCSRCWRDGLHPLEAT